MSEAGFRSVGFIFARGGSKGVPGKNIRPLAGKPLIAHAIEVGLATPGIETVIVSTDDAAIAEVARAHGAEVPFERPAELAQDNSPEWLAWQHAIRWHYDNRGRFDCFVSLPATSPFRVVGDVAACIDIVRQDPETDAVITVTASNRSPYFNMVTIGADLLAEVVIKSDGAAAFRRQDAPPVYDMTTVAYAARPDFVLGAERLFAGRVRAVTVPVERAADIDTEFDFCMAEAIAAMQDEGK
ncbi:cytidylyltransferase domain-containing protein [Devosia sp. XGJD_8]|uniref:acylneuraminate cytidylyltransferase family protein n=1 Tax=Devosia sp. XGJD_8 TaxID=3391187 RepID=UPI0039853EAA